MKYLVTYLSPNAANPCLQQVIEGVIEPNSGDGQVRIVRYGINRAAAAIDDDNCMTRTTVFAAPVQSVIIKLIEDEENLNPFASNAGLMQG